MPGSPAPSLVQIITGRPRPIHLRFATALAELVPGVSLQRRDRSLLYRARMNALQKLTGLRTAEIGSSGAPVLLHQAGTKCAAT
jgi:hypothetical protein